MEDAIRILEIVANSWAITFAFVAVCGALLIAGVSRRHVRESITSTRISADKELELARLKYMHGQVEGRAIRDDRNAQPS
jgi:hypothetical protein